MEDEGQPLGRAQRVEHDEEGDADGVGQERLVLGIGLPGTVQDDIGHVRLHRVLAPRTPGAQDVQRHPGNHCREPAAQVLDVGGVGPVEADPGLLDGVVHLTERAEHPVGHGAQVGPVLLEALRRIVHRWLSSCRLASGVKTRRTGEM